MYCTASVTTSCETEIEEAPQCTVKIGKGQHIALNGQEMYQKYIVEETDICVQCINCQNWMQVTDTATLMFVLFVKLSVLPINRWKL